MKTRILLLAVFLITSTLTFAGGQADDKPASQFAGEYDFMISSLEKKFVSLAEAIPQEKYSWRPAEGVRSIAEVYLHLAQSVKYLLGTIGDEVPAEYNVEPKEYEGATIKKEDIINKLKDSFAYTKAACIKLNDAALNKEVNFFGNKVRVMVVLESLQGHAHEHLGQSIAYARMVGVTPPWSKGE